ncbi:hypothetical protein [Natronoarchaeum rubrum]|uniref:hypothetical protein n=1 Tax=Natronoarchaeum rubrum TaxID=755311 RepID=UPI00211138A2|nr:hypothetical protein [Natronoarchaeum rubrum]
MNENLAEALDTAISESDAGRFELGEVPAELQGSDYVNGTESLPNRCQRPGCRKSCAQTRREDGKVVMQCRRELNPHEFTVDSSNFTFYDLDFGSILETITSHLDEEIKNSDRDLPRQVTAFTESGLRVVLPVAPSEFDREMMEVYATALQLEQPTLLITPEDRLEDLLDLASLLSTGSLVYAAPISGLHEMTDHLQTMANTARSIKDLEQEFISSRYDEDDAELVHQVNINPRYILTELNHMRLLRKAGRLSGGDRLETISELAFSHLFSTYPGEGGEDSSGQSLPDNLYWIPQLAAGDRPASILGVVDAKSGNYANFGKEEARGKHDEYLERAEREKIEVDRVAHTFLILEFKGQAEIEFFDKMDVFYGKDTHLVIFTADALAMIMSAYLAATVSNELELIRGDFRSIIYALFEPDEFKKRDLHEEIRNVGRGEEEYINQYLTRPQLLIVTKEVVDRLLTDALNSSNEIESVYERYFSDMPDF